MVAAFFVKSLTRASAALILKLSHLRQLGAIMNLTQAQAERLLPIIEETFLFKGVALEELTKLLLSLEVEYLHYNSGETILEQSIIKPCLGILLSGSAIVEKHSGEGFMAMSVLSQGQLFGMASLFSCGERQPYPVCIIAGDNTSALVIREETLKQLFSRNHLMAENYICHLTGRIHFLNNRLSHIIQPTVEERVLFYLKHSAEGGNIKSFSALAKSLCISRASLYRALESLEKRGSIKKSGREVSVLSEQHETFY